MTIFVKSKRVMVSKEELRKLDKEQLVNLVSDLLIQSDALASLVHHLQDEINKLKTHKNSATVLFRLPMIYSVSEIKALGAKVARNQGDNLAIKEKHFVCRPIRTK